MNQTKLIEEQKRGKRYFDDEDLEKTQNRRFYSNYYKRGLKEVGISIQKLENLSRKFYPGTNVMKMSDVRANRSLSTSIDSALDDDHVNFLLRDHQVKVHSVDLSGEQTQKP